MKFLKSINKLYKKIRLKANIILSCKRLYNISQTKVSFDCILNFLERNILMEIK